MAWFQRRRPRGQLPEPLGLVSGMHRSPGLLAVLDSLAGRGEASVLDLGPSSTENVSFLAQLGASVQIQDLFRSSGGAHGSRSEVFRFEDPAALPLPESGSFDAILVWDLMHYCPQPRIPAFIARLEPLSKPGTLLLAMASATAPIPTTPMQFKIADRDRLEYLIYGNDRAAAPDLTPRRVEKLMPGFMPLRLFQLRNGLQELVFQLREPEPSALPIPPSSGQAV